jgi:hypothetical protein
MVSSTARPVTRGKRHLPAAALLSAALLAGLAGCGYLGSTASTSTGVTATASAMPAASPLAGLSSAQIVTRALADLRTASTVHVTGSVTGSGLRIRLNIRLVRGKGCAGRMALQGMGAFRLIMIGKTVWLKPNNAFWTHFGGSNAGALQLLEGKWVEPSRTGQLSAFGQLCQPSQLAGSFGKVPAMAMGKHITVAGQPALQLGGTDKQGSGFLDVSVSASPEVLRIISTGTDPARLDFAGYGRPVTLAPPPASQTINGKNFGF